MATTDFSPRYSAASVVSAFSTSQIIGGRLYKISGDKTAQGDYQVALCGLGDPAFGAAQYSSAPTSVDANAQVRRVAFSRRGAIARVAVGATAIDVSSGPVALKSDASGKVIPQASSGTIIGYACHSAAANATYVEVDLV